MSSSLDRPAFICTTECGRNFFTGMPGDGEIVFSPCHDLAYPHINAVDLAISVMCRADLAR
jgi:hypothetical protein